MEHDHRDERYVLGLGRIALGDALALGDVQLVDAVALAQIIQGDEAVAIDQMAPAGRG